jgi:hypothetical protein
MKNNFKTIGLVVFASLGLISCSNDNENPITTNDLPTAQEFKALKDVALSNITQSFTMTAGTGVHTFTTAKGVQFTINSNCLTEAGNPVTSGQISIEYVEVFDPGTMLVTDKTTMGKLPNGDMALIISGGEFYINAKRNGQQLDITCPMQLLIPSALTGGAKPGMLLWDGIIDENGNLDWDEQEPNPGQNGGVFNEGQGANAPYLAFINDFGWTNVDKFYSDPRPKTTILAEAPSGYNFQNSGIYLHYDGQGSALAKLDTFNSGTNQFSEHYGQIPIGLQCHVIFITEENGNFKYAIQAVTVAANDVYVFTEAQTTTGTEAQLIAAINALP